MTSVAEAVEAKERDPHASDSSLRYMPGLDVARALAIVLVLCYHSLANFISLDAAAPDRATRFLLFLTAVGSHGVHLFFVLSGFLITGILLDSCEKPGYYRTFYLRRALRIIPASLLVLFGLKAAHWISWRFLWAAALNCANLPRLFGTVTEFGVMWSLSVEEQFYLLWPAVVRRAGRHALAAICVALILLTPMLRLALQYGPQSLRDISFKTWVVCDFFAAGALIAIAARSAAWMRYLPQTRALCLLCGAALVLLYSCFAMPATGFASKLSLALQLEPWLLLCSGIVIFAFLKPSIAEHPMAAPALFLAKVSYGLYLVHPIVFRLVERYWILPAENGLQAWSLFFSRFVVESVLAVGVAAISRFTFEEFFLRLKPRPVSAAAVAAIY